MATIGHDDIWGRFKRTLARGRLASTYLFVGPEGIGKRTFAVDLAHGLLCQSPAQAQSLAPCGTCESCTLFTAGSHPDLLSIAKPPGKSSLPIELFLGRAEHRNREGLCHDIALKPFLAGRRIAIIDDADDLGVESANALLKTLEEPPPRSVLILIGTSLSKQLPTIRSRSQVVRFTPLATHEVAQVLRERQLLDVGEPLAEGDSADARAALSAGRVSLALAAGDASLVEFRRELISVLGSPAPDPLRLAEAVLDQAQAGGAEPALRRQRLRTIFGYAIDHYRDQMRSAAQASAAPSRVDNRILHRLDHCLEMAAALDRNANQATLVQTWLVGLTQ